MIDRIMSTKILVSVVIVLGISLSMHQRSYDAISGATQQILQQDLFTPTRLEMPTGDGFPTVTDDADAARTQQQQSNQQHQPRLVNNGKPLNVVVMYGDDWRHDALGIASNGVVETPFIDWLSRNKGMRFTHNCVSTSICWISRATLHTGQYYSRHKAENPGSEEWYNGFHEAFPALLNKAGYFVSHIGKWHTWNSGKIQKWYHNFNEYYGRHWYPGNPTPSKFFVRSLARTL